MKRIVSVALLALTGLTAACDSDSTGPGVAGTFDLETTGALTETAEGPAWFGSDVNDENEPVFLLLLGDESSRHVVIAGKAGATRPGVGTYPISEIGGTGWELLHIVSDDSDLIALFTGVEGQISITTSSSSKLSGTIDFVATGFMGTEEVEIEGSISFDAAPAPAVQALSLRSIR
jgi:hypothetical protein